MAVCGRPGGPTRRGPRPRASTGWLRRGGETGLPGLRHGGPNGSSGTRDTPGTGTALRTHGGAGKAGRGRAGRRGTGRLQKERRTPYRPGSVPVRLLSPFCHLKQCRAKAHCASAEYLRGNKNAISIYRDGIVVSESQLRHERRGVIRHDKIERRCSLSGDRRHPHGGRHRDPRRGHRGVRVRHGKQHGQGQTRGSNRNDAGHHGYYHLPGRSGC